MTVAAVILAASAESALADADGLASVRRIADAAWSGGATPIVVVSSDPDGAVAAALAGASVTLATPAPVEGGPVAQIRRGIEVARAEIQGTDAAIVWPARLTWVGPETVTSLIEAHGTDLGTLLRPAFDGEPGWPALVPVRHVELLARIDAERGPDDVLFDLGAAGVPIRLLDLGDPGTTHDRGVPIAELPPYEGPPEPAARHTHEWGAGLADEPEDSPLEGPALAPFGQAADPDQPS
ncbi:MAG TPA: NTP transferase domain-containing protein [Candidatus Eisenbacteria bacterium]|nr:NTP transferase domain-containing protein [Candidatus Eisenbacteria bacterium]